jgi:hypothetical protein
MTVFLITSLVLISIIGFTGIKILFNRKKKKSTSNKEVSEGKSKKIKLDTDVEEFKEVKSFNRDKYIVETFNQVFHAIRVDEWESKFNYNLIEFKKDKITVKIDYKDYDNFKIKSITLTSGYSNFHYNEPLDESIYRFFYNVYSENVKRENEAVKKATDDSLVEIHKVIGKSSIRDNKLDQLLNG